MGFEPTFVDFESIVHQEQFLMYCKCNCTPYGNRTHICRSKIYYTNRYMNGAY